MGLLNLLQRGYILLDRAWNADDMVVVNADLTCSINHPSDPQAYVDCYFETKDNLRNLEAGNPNIFLDE